MLDGRSTIEQQIFSIANMNIMKLVCSKFTLYQMSFVISFRPVISDSDKNYDLNFNTILTL